MIDHVIRCRSKLLQLGFSEFAMVLIYDNLELVKN